MRVKIFNPAKRLYGKATIETMLGFTSKGVLHTRLKVFVLLSSSHHAHGHYKKHEHQVTLYLPRDFNGAISLLEDTGWDFPIYDREESAVALMAHEFAHVAQANRENRDLARGIVRKRIWSEAKADRRAVEFVAKWRSFHAQQNPIVIWKDKPE